MSEQTTSTPIVLTDTEADAMVDWFSDVAADYRPNTPPRILAGVANRIRAQRDEARPIQPGDRVRLLGDGPNWRPGKVLAVESNRCWVRWDGYPIPNTHSACGLVRVPVGGDNL